MIKEHLDLIRGRGTYIDDIQLKGEVYLSVIRSTYAKAKVKEIGEPSHALLFLRPEDVRQQMPAVTIPNVKTVRMPVLSYDVNFVGQPIAAVVTEGRYETEDVNEEVGVDYEPLTPVVNVKDSLKGDILVHDDLGTNVSVDVDVKGGESVRNEAEVVVEREISQNRVVSNPMEPKGVIADYRDGILTLYASTQAPFRVKNDIREALDIAPEKIRVIAPRVGGGFGNKVPAYPEYVLASIASMKLGRPVKWIETRKEHLVDPIQGRGVHGKVKLYAKRDGVALGIEGEITVDLGAYNYTMNAMMPIFISRLLTGPYKMKYASVRARGVFTNLTPTGPYRGAGRPEATLFHETLMEDLARELGMSPVEVREKNLIDEEYMTPTGLRIDKGGYREVFQRAKEIYNSIRVPGKSLVVFAEIVSTAPGETCKVSVGNGKVTVTVPSGPHGQAHGSTFAKLASEVLGVGEDRIEVITGVTDGVREGVGSFGSRTASVGGSAVVEASKKLMEEISRKGLTVEEAISSHETSVEVFLRADPIFSAGAHVAVVTYDGVTPRVSQYYAVDDVGRAIIRDEVEGQIIGGVLQGVSQVFWEKVAFDESGNPVISSIGDEGVPTAVEANYVTFPEIVEFRSSMPDGARGVGEAGTTGAVAATVIAIENALGIRVNETPIPPEVLQRINSRGG